MRLDVDIGNTRIKWRFMSKLGEVSSGAAKTQEISTLGNIFADIDTASILAIYVGSVVPSSVPIFKALCKRYTPCEPIFAEVSPRCAGVVNAYKDVSQMGVDRWLALLAAKDLCSHSCVVVDVGSAITVDLLSSSGRHLGGYIAPGLRLMNAALFQNTGKVNVPLSDYPAILSAGTSTQEAVNAALPRMLIGLVHQAVDELVEAAEGSISIVVTGGDGQYLAGHLQTLQSKRVLYVPTLVLDGLCLAIEGVDGDV